MNQVRKYEKESRIRSIIPHFREMEEGEQYFSSLERCMIKS